MLPAAHLLRSRAFQESCSLRMAKSWIAMEVSPRRRWVTSGKSAVQGTAGRLKRLGPAWPQSRLLMYVVEQAWSDKSQVVQEVAISLQHFEKFGHGLFLRYLHAKDGCWRWSMVRTRRSRVFCTRAYRSKGHVESALNAGATWTLVFALCPDESECVVCARGHVADSVLHEWNSKVLPSAHARVATIFLSCTGQQMGSFNGSLTQNVSLPEWYGPWV
mmetsp:Transcript_8547/g.20386  ORF Transcript_8547/g.20386 Transcript_8547/m.20386 type:complete len:217 (+) Transcript_8547:690-1340(+)